MCRAASAAQPSQTAPAASAKPAWISMTPCQDPAHGSSTPLVSISVAIAPAFGPVE